MEIVRKIQKKLENALEYYNETKDVEDLVVDIKEIISELITGYI